MIQKHVQLRIKPRLCRDNSMLYQRYSSENSPLKRQLDIIPKISARPRIAHSRDNSILYQRYPSESSPLKRQLNTMSFAGIISLVRGFSCLALFLPTVTLGFRQFGFGLASVMPVGQLNPRATKQESLGQC
jgi:hypothetical protein